MLVFSKFLIFFQLHFVIYWNSHVDDLACLRFFVYDYQKFFSLRRCGRAGSQSFTVYYFTTINIVFTILGSRRFYWRDSTLISLSTGIGQPLKSFKFNIRTWKYQIRVPGNVKMIWNSNVFAHKYTLSIYIINYQPIANNIDSPL